MRARAGRRRIAPRPIPAGSPAVRSSRPAIAARSWPRRRAQRIPQVGAGRVRQCTRLHVCAHAGAETVRADVGLEHAHDRLALAADHVRVVRPGGRELVGDVLVDRLRSSPARRRASRPPCRRSCGSHQCHSGWRSAVSLCPIQKRQALVEPHLVPPAPSSPGRRTTGAPSRAPGRGTSSWRSPSVLAGRQQQQAVVVGDRAPVLHRAGETAGYRDRVELRQRKRVAEIVAVVGEDLLRIGQRDRRPRARWPRTAQTLNCVPPASVPIIARGRRPSARRR